MSRAETIVRALITLDNKYRVRESDWQQYDCGVAYEEIAAASDALMHQTEPSAILKNSSNDDTLPDRDSRFYFRFAAISHAILNSTDPELDSLKALTKDMFADLLDVINNNKRTKDGDLDYCPGYLFKTKSTEIKAWLTSSLKLLQSWQTQATVTPEQQQLARLAQLSIQAMQQQISNEGWLVSKLAHRFLGETPQAMLNCCIDLLQKPLAPLGTTAAKPEEENQSASSIRHSPRLLHQHSGKKVTPAFDATKPLKDYLTQRKSKDTWHDGVLNYDYVPEFFCHKLGSIKQAAAHALIELLDNDNPTYFSLTNKETFINALLEPGSELLLATQKALQLHDNSPGLRFVINAMIEDGSPRESIEKALFLAPTI